MNFGGLYYIILTYLHYFTPITGHRLTWQAYHRLEDIHGFIDYMAKTYPDICSTEIIGYSVEKRPRGSQA